MVLILTFVGADSVDASGVLLAVVSQSSLLLHVAVALVDVCALLASVAGEAVVAAAGEGEEAADAGGQRVAVVVARGAVVG